MLLLFMAYENNFLCPRNLKFMIYLKILSFLYVLSSLWLKKVFHFTFYIFYFSCLSVWVEESVGTLELFLTLQGIISIFHHKIYLLVFVKKRKKKSFIRLRNFPSIPNMLSFYPFTFILCLLRMAWIWIFKCFLFVVTFYILIKLLNKFLPLYFVPSPVFSSFLIFYLKLFFAGCRIPG